jgi:hypothetical protein
MNQTAQSPSTPTPANVGVTYLDPAKTKIFRGSFDMLHVSVEGPQSSLFRGVFAVRAFPVSHPDQFISLRYIDPTDNHEHEIGVIENVSTFPPDAQELILHTLSRHYYESTITGIRSVKWQYNLLFFEVETTRGQQSFMMRWAYDRAVAYGEKGKVLLDVFDNRYVIPNVEALPAADLDLFQRWIYW